MSALTDLAERDPVLAGRLALLRLLMLDRRISARAIGRHVGRSHTHVAEFLSGKYPNSHIWLDVIDDAINDITVRRHDGQEE